jgi:hypothetical protein
MAAPLFPLRQLVATPGALALLADAHTNPTELLTRHQADDWGGVSPEDARESSFSWASGAIASSAATSA